MRSICKDKRGFDWKFWGGHRLLSGEVSERVKVRVPEVGLFSTGIVQKYPPATTYYMGKVLL